MRKIGKKMKMELALAVIVTIVVSSLAVYVNLLGQRETGAFLLGSTQSYRQDESDYAHASAVQQIITEDIRGELKKGSFETVVLSIRGLIASYHGRVPSMTMFYDNDLWTGMLDCKIPTGNVTQFTFDVRQVIGEHGRVTHIGISITEVEVNETDQAEEQFSKISMSLKEVSGEQSPIISQIGSVIPWLVTGLVWMAEGLIIGVPLCFVSLGIVLLIDRAIIPTWKKQFKSRTLNKPEDTMLEE
jgi:hypothetical protein